MNTHESSDLTIAVDFDVVPCLGRRSVVHSFVSLLPDLPYLSFSFKVILILILKMNQKRGELQSTRRWASTNVFVVLVVVVALLLVPPALFLNL